MIICPKCSSKVSKVKYCTSCGFLFSKTSKIKKSSTGSDNLKTLISLLIFLVFLTAGYFLFTYEEGSDFNDFKKAMSDESDYRNSTYGEGSMKLVSVMSFDDGSSFGGVKYAMQFISNNSSWVFVGSDASDVKSYFSSKSEVPLKHEGSNYKRLTDFKKDLDKKGIETSEIVRVDYGFKESNKQKKSEISKPFSEKDRLDYQNKIKDGLEKYFYPYEYINKVNIKPTKDGKYSVSVYMNLEVYAPTSDDIETIIINDISDLSSVVVIDRLKKINKKGMMFLIDKELQNQKSREILIIKYLLVKRNNSWKKG